MLKKAIYIVGCTVLIVGSIFFTAVNSQATREVKLDEQFEVSEGEGVKLINYPLYMVVTDIDCSNACGGDDVAFYINYPTGYKELSISRGEALSYKGATLTLVKFTNTSATFYATLGVAPHAPGTNVVDSNGTIWFITEYYTRKAYPSAYVYRSYKFNTWDSIISANSADMSLPIHEAAWNNGDLNSPRNGALVNDQGTVYIITRGFKMAFPTDKMFRGSPTSGFGYSYHNVYSMDTGYINEFNGMSSAAEQHPDGTLIIDRGTLYIMAHGGRYGVPTMAILDSWGYWSSDAVVANSYDIEAYYGGTLGHRPIHKLNIE